VNRHWCFVLVLATVLACRQTPAPSQAGSPAPALPAEKSAGPRPLTSRDSAPQAESKQSPGPVSSDTTALPSGHPPIDGLPPGHAPMAAGSPGTRRAGSAPPIAGRVSLAPALGAKIGPTDVLYLIAKNTQTKTIEAVRRQERPVFPLRFELSGADSMTGDGQFTGPFEITARLSRTGDAIPATGDLEGVIRGVSPGAKDVAITIDTVRK
jgi:cytochrome c-type biogenesis protein CcmH